MPDSGAGTPATTTTTTSLQPIILAHIASSHIVVVFFLDLQPTTIFRKILMISTNAKIKSKNQTKKRGIGRIRFEQEQNFESSYIIIFFIIFLRNLTKLSILIASPWKRLPFTAENRSSAIIPEIAFSKISCAHHDYISLPELPRLL